VATQRMAVATLAGDTATRVMLFFEQCQNSPNADSIDRFSSAIRAHGLALPIVYFTEWVDRWLMGNSILGADCSHGHRFQAAVLSPEQAIAWADQCGNQFPEQEWLACRLREAAAGWGTVSERYAVVIFREVPRPINR